MRPIVTLWRIAALRGGKRESSAFAILKTINAPVRLCDGGFVCIAMS